MPPTHLALPRGYRFTGGPGFCPVGRPSWTTDWAKRGVVARAAPVRTSRGLWLLVCAAAGQVGADRWRGGRAVTEDGYVSVETRQPAPTMNSTSNTSAANSRQGISFGGADGSA
jgi:hypothetical protein